MFFLKVSSRLLMVPSIELNSARNSIIKGPLNRAKLGLHVIINHPSIVLKPVPV